MDLQRIVWVAVWLIGGGSVALIGLSRFLNSARRNAPDDKIDDLITSSGVSLNGDGKRRRWTGFDKTLHTAAENRRRKVEKQKAEALRRLTVPLPKPENEPKTVSFWNRK